MRAYAHQPQHVVIQFLIDQDEVRSDVAIPVVGPNSGKWVITVPLGKWLVDLESRQHFGQ